MERGNQGALELCFGRSSEKYTVQKDSLLKRAPGPSGEAFDHVGAGYDDYLNTELGVWFRRRVWERLGTLFKSGDRVLEIGCGTGQDAIWLAQRGVHVLASDASEAMLTETMHKAKAAGVDSMITAQLLDLNKAADWWINLDGGLFDGAYSDNGPLNCIPDWHDVGAQLSRVVKPGGKIGLGVMGPYCPFEVIWYGIHRDFRNATRRFRRQTVAHLDGKYFNVYYPTPAQLKRSLGSAFRQTGMQGIGVFAPPVGRIRRVVRPLLVLERLFAARWPFKYLGDYYWLELEKV
jgi:ubiquinone/menaquinone biosynthesis C-methylase UbiE